LADIAITAANVVPVANEFLQLDKSYVAGETIAAGAAVYLDTTGATFKWMKADADSATAAARRASGIALSSASLNQPLVVQTAGDITIGGTVAANTHYYLSGAVAGAICPLADVGTGEYLQLIGIGLSTSVIRLSFLTTGLAN
jgi:hypothetical protein